jgi:hypothetical protein
MDVLTPTILERVTHGVVVRPRARRFGRILAPDAAGAGPPALDADSGDDEVFLPEGAGEQDIDAAVDVDPEDNVVSL